MLDFRLAFPFGLTLVLVKNTLLASYAAVQHIAWDVMDVMTIQVTSATLDVNVNYENKLTLLLYYYSNTGRQIVIKLQVADELHTAYHIG